MISKCCRAEIVDEPFFTLEELHNKISILEKNLERLAVAVVRSPYFTEGDGEFLSGIIPQDADKLYP